MNIIFHCPECGQKIEAPAEYSGREIICPTCQKTIICPKDGTEKVMDVQKIQNSQRSQPSQNTSTEFNAVVYTLLGIFYGLFGAHNFYNRENIYGWLRLISSIFAIPMLFNGAGFAQIAYLILAVSQFFVILELSFQHLRTKP